MADQSKRLEKAEKYLQKGKQDAALDVYLDILKDDPNTQNVRQMAADLCVTLGRNQDAARLLDEIFEHSAKIGDRGKAVATYKKLARLGAPPVKQTWRYAELLDKANKKEALEAYELCANAFLASGAKPDALAALKGIIELEPSLENLKREGELAAELNDCKEAASTFLRIGELERQANPGKEAAGAEWSARAYALDSENLQAALAHGHALIAAGKKEEAVGILEAPATDPGSSPEMREAYCIALLGVGRLADAEPYIWDLFDKDPKRIDDVAELVAQLIDSGNFVHALEIAKKLEQHEIKAGRRREYISLIKDITDQHPPGIEFLEYLVGIYNSVNRESDYCRSLTKLFELYYAAGNFLKAGDSLDRAVDVDPYESGHGKRLEMLKGKIDANILRAIAGRRHAVGAGRGEGDKEKKEKDAAEGEEPTVLEDLMLQAEIYLQYSMRAKAIERIERIHKLFPGEEAKNDKLRSLFMNAGFTPKYPAGSAPVAPPAAQAATSGAHFTSHPPPGADQSSVENITRVTDITRNIYRQANVKGVLFAAVNDIGRHWNSSRCVAALAVPGKPPSAMSEYCAPEVKQSAVNARVNLIAGLQEILAAQGVVSAEDATSPPLANLQAPIQELEIKSLLAIPMIDGEQVCGILTLEQCDRPRTWLPTESVVMRTIAEQTVNAVNNVKLRSLMKTLAVTEEKSGLLKRASYMDVLLAEMKRALAQNVPVTLVLLHFGNASTLLKEMGEASTENMMQAVGQTVCSHIRQSDIAVRYTLTTVALILPDTDEEHAFMAIEKMRKVFSSADIPGTAKPIPFTVGIAEAVVKPRFDAVDLVTEVINRVENALQAAKGQGGNKPTALRPNLTFEEVA